MKVKLTKVHGQWLNTEYCHFHEKFRLWYFYSVDLLGAPIMVHLDPAAFFPSPIVVDTHDAIVAAQFIGAHPPCLYRAFFESDAQSILHKCDYLRIPTHKNACNPQFTDIKVDAFIDNLITLHFNLMTTFPVPRDQYNRWCDRGWWTQKAIEVFKPYENKTH